MKHVRPVLATASSRLSALVLLALTAACLAPSAALAATTVCRSDRTAGVKLRASQLSCADARRVQRDYLVSPACIRDCFVTAARRTWRCGARILSRSRLGGLVRGRVLCRDARNIGRFARWEYRGRGA